MRTAVRAVERRAKGINLVDLVKLLRQERRERDVKLTPVVMPLLEERILPTSWYAHDVFVTLLQAVNVWVFGNSEETALRRAVLGGRTALLGTYKVYMQPGDPQASVLALRHSWPSFFDFGAMRAEPRLHAVEFTITGYEDVCATHAMMIAGWAIAAAELAGAVDARVTFLDQPWLGGSALRYRVEL